MLFTSQALFIASIALHGLNVAAQAFPGPTWSFPLRLNMGGGAFRTQPDISFVEDTLFPTLNLRGSFTILGWLRPSSTQAWRTFVSIESPECDTSLFNVAFPPNSMEIYFAYMVNRNVADRENVFTKINAPGPNTKFHFAISKNSTHFDVYLNGVQRFSHSIKGQIFNPSNKNVVLGKTKYQNVDGAQWEGLINGMDIFNRTLTPHEIRKEIAFTSQEI